MHYSLGKLFTNSNETIIADFRGTTELSLYVGSFPHRSRPEELAAAFARIPPNIITRFNFDSSLGLTPGTRLAALCAGIPASVIDLNLRAHGLYLKTSTELVIAFGRIRARMTHLDLSCNGLGKKTEAEVGAIFAGIPESVIYLNLSLNSFDKVTTTGLAHAFARIPENVREITLSQEDIVGCSNEGLIVLGKALSHVMRVHVLDDNNNPVTSAQVKFLNAYVGCWVATMDKLLYELAFPQAISNLTLQIATGASVKELTTFTATIHHLPKKKSYQAPQQFLVTAPVVPKPLLVRRRGGLREHSLFKTMDPPMPDALQTKGSCTIL